MNLDPVLAAELSERRERLLTAGQLPTEEQLAAQYATFRERFGPQVIQGLDGYRLLETFHGGGNRDSLAYWIEFKNDEAFRSPWFGSIAGGSALKFGIFQNVESRQWIRGSNQNQIRLSEREATAFVRQQRDELLAASQVVAQAAQAGEELDVPALQARLTEVAPGLHDLAWFHKYLCLLFPEVVDAFHVQSYSRFHLIKLLQVPSDLEGRFVNAGHYAAAARAAGMPLQHLAFVLNDRNGALHAYWRVGTRGSKDGESQWPLMRDSGYIAIGWSRLGDLSNLTRDREDKDDLRRRLDEAHPAPTASAQGNAARQILNFVTKAQARDVVLACDGATVLGVGRITGDYAHAPGQAFPHHRPVEWLDLDSWPMPVHEGLRTRFVALGKQPENLVEAERRALHRGPLPVTPIRAGTAAPPPPLTGHPARIDKVLQRKGQVILYGPPGTGKTHQAQLAMRELAARGWHGRAWGDLTEAEQAELSTTALATCTFHPGYGYEDFVEGYRPEEREGTLLFVRRDGLFKAMCAQAAGDPARRPFFLLIDEINRGDIPRIFGELITLLEKTRRGEVVRLAQSGESFSVPDNLYVIGTMNTADRSIALLDAALRRRFGFVELMPEPEVLQGAAPAGIPLGPWLNELNKRIVQHVGRDARNLQVGHAYLLHRGKPVSEPGRFAEILRDDIVPLLEEYCYENYDALEQILGKALVDREAQRIRTELFLPEKADRLAEALLGSSPDILASVQAVETEAAQDDPEPAEEDEGEAA